MKLWRYSVFLATAVSPCVWSPAWSVESHKPAAQKSPREATASERELRRLNAEVIKTTLTYKESLEKLLEIYEGELENLTKEVEKRRPFYQQGYISKRELEQSEEKLSHVEANINDTRQRISEANLVITETSAREELRRAPALAVGDYRETTALIRFNGGARWSLAGAGKIEKFFRQTFGHSLPISALGQTAVHDRMGFDHRDAMDVALRPDSPEGRALMVYLREQAIPFIAFRGKVAGSATGAHIHIGKPSLRVASFPRSGPL